MKQINLTQGEVAIVDDDDYDRLSKYKWRLQKNHNCKYAMSGKYPQTLYMHHLILCAVPGKIIDHVDNNGLNNQKLNLRYCTHAQNMRNRSKYTISSSRYKGVSLVKSTHKWEASIRLDGKKLHLGQYESEEEASVVYDDASRKLHGQFSKTNNPFFPTVGT